MLEWIVILSLVTWRISSMLHMEDMFHWLRKLLGIEHNDSEDHYNWGYPNNIIGSVFGCFYCMTLVVSFLLSLVMFTLYSWWQVLFIWLASATGAIVTEKWIGRSKARW